jgi:hypothetical protein
LRPGRHTRPARACDIFLRISEQLKTAWDDHVRNSDVSGEHKDAFARFRTNRSDWLPGDFDPIRGWPA